MEEDTHVLDFMYSQMFLLDQHTLNLDQFLHYIAFELHLYSDMSNVIDLCYLLRMLQFTLLILILSILQNLRSAYLPLSDLLLW